MSQPGESPKVGVKEFNYVIDGCSRRSSGCTVLQGHKSCLERGKGPPGGGQQELPRGDREGHLPQRQPAAHSSPALTGVITHQKDLRASCLAVSQKIMQNIQLLPAVFRNYKTSGFLLVNNRKELVLKQ